MELAPKLFEIPGVQYLLTEKFCQDSLESYFGKQRYQGCCNTNPTVDDFLSNAASIRTQGSAALEPLRGNSRRGRKRVVEVDDTPLPKRSRTRKRLADFL